MTVRRYVPFILLFLASFAVIVPVESMNLGTERLWIWLIGLVPTFVVAYDHALRGALFSFALYFLLHLVFRLRESGSIGLFNESWWRFWLINGTLLIFAMSVGWMALMLRREREQSIYRARFTDATTGAYNRAYLTEIQGKHVLFQKPYALLYLNIDHFRWVNELYEDEAGDALLRAVIDRIKGVLRDLRLDRDAALLFRHGGDVFLLFIALDASIPLSDVVDRLRACLIEPFSAGKEAIAITVSMSVVYATQGEHPSELIRVAEHALTEAKKHGRGRITVLDGSRAGADGDQRTGWLRDLQSAMENEQFYLVYQPIIDVRRHRVEAVEALLRWRHPEHGDISPARFIPYAEAYGLMPSLGMWALHKAFHFCERRNARAGEPLDVSVNVSLQQLDGDFVAAIAQLAANASHIVPRIRLEVTESVMADAERVIPLLEDLKRLGFRIYLDDFGTGYSSLGYLLTLPVDGMKFDRSFVRQLNGRGGEVIRSLVRLADRLGLHTVVEGVETREHASLLISWGVSHIQGFCYARPMDEEALEHFLASWRADSS
ncbi:MAG: bifunctional diguanylate cyclase/phosphodiesterase [Hydrogenibacillus sp.]|nr:bifunctional diguanylate cyclase/phosphodiesterase [Hydrogenibacillus sp.]